MLFPVLQSCLFNHHHVSTGPLRTPPVAADIEQVGSSETGGAWHSCW